MHIGIQLVGRHPCLWCQVRRDELAIPPEERQSTPQLRSLQTLQHNYLGFTTLSGGDLRKAKQHCNVIGKSFFLIPLDQVIIQSICFCANLNEAFSLIDMSPRPAHKPRYILSPLHPLGSGLQPAGCQSCYKEYCECLREMAELQGGKQHLEEEAAILDQAVTFLSLQTTSTNSPNLLSQMQDGARVRRTQIADLVRLTEMKRPCSTFYIHTRRGD